MISGGAASVRNVTGSPPGVPLTPGGSGAVDGACTMTRSASTKVAKTRKMRKAVWRCLLREAEAGDLRLGTAGCGATHIRLLAQRAESGWRADPRYSPMILVTLKAPFRQVNRSAFRR